MGRFRTPSRLAAVWIAFLVVAASGLMSCTREVSGSPVKSNPMFSVDLGTVLLDADEIDDVMGTSGSEVLDEGNAPDDTVEAKPVVLGPLDDGLRVVREGLKPDDRVIVDGLQRARVGAKVAAKAAEGAKP